MSNTLRALAFSLVTLKTDLNFVSQLEKGDDPYLFIGQNVKGHYLMT